MSYSKAGCKFCTGVSESQQSHQRDKCPEFKELKENTSYKPYVKAKLNDEDERGFAAAGFLLWKKGNKKNLEILMAREDRQHKDRLNFLGGKRLQKAKSAIEVAVKKVGMECGRQLSPEALEGMKGAPLVLWSGNASKYALFLYELTLWRDWEVHVSAASLRDGGVKKLEWVSCKDLKSTRFIKNQLHGFARDMVHALSDHENTQEEVQFDSEVIAGLTSSPTLGCTGVTGDEDTIAAAITAKLSEIRLK